MERWQTAWEGFTFQPNSEDGAEAGSGLLFGPDGSHAGIHWVLSADGPYIMRLEPPGPDHWGVYEVGFTQPVAGQADLLHNLEALLPKLATIYRRIRTH